MTSGKGEDVRISPADLFRLHSARLDAERAALIARLAENRARRWLLEVELEYGLLGRDAVLDMATGEISHPSLVKDEEVPIESNRDENTSP